MENYQIIKLGFGGVAQCQLGDTWSSPTGCAKGFSNQEVLSKISLTNAGIQGLPGLRKFGCWKRTTVLEDVRILNVI